MDGAQVPERPRGGEGVAPLALGEQRAVDAHRLVANALHAVHDVIGELPGDGVADGDGEVGGENVISSTSTTKVWAWPLSAAGAEVAAEVAVVVGAEAGSSSEPQPDSSAAARTNPVAMTVA